MSPWEETKKGVREQVGSLFTIYDGIQKNATTGSYDLYILNKVAAHLRITSTSLESSTLATWPLQPSPVPGRSLALQEP
jgi:hypothetical protein